MISRCFDIPLIREAMTHPKVYQHISDDGCPKEFEPVLTDALIFLAVNDPEFLGVFLFHPQNFVTYEVHTALLPEAWGKSVEYGKAAIEWMFANTPCKRVVTNVPKYNRLAKRLSEQVGMKEYGMNPKSFQKNGVLHDQIMFGLSKE